MNDMTAVLAMFFGALGIFASFAFKDSSFLFYSLVPFVIGLAILLLEKKEKKDQIRKIRKNETEYLSKYHDTSGNSEAEERFYEIYPAANPADWKKSAGSDVEKSSSEKFPAVSGEKKMSKRRISEWMR